MIFYSIDEMKLTKDVVNGQVTSLDIDQILAIYKANYPTLTHIAISVPLSSNAEFIAHGNTPKPLAVEDFEKLWVSKIHGAGLNVIFRGTFCDDEAIYNFPVVKADASVWKAKALAYVNRLTPQLKAGDVIAIFPESTNNAFNGNLFLADSSANGYNAFFTDLIASINAIVVPLGCFTYITNNYTELNSGWAGGIPPAEKAVVMDHYGSGQRLVADLQNDIEAIHKKYNLPVGLQEWGDINGQGPAYITSMAAMFTQEIAKGTLFMINFWCGWSAPNEGILENSNNTWTLNAKGKALIPFFTGVTSTPVPTPVPAPAPVPTPTPTTGKIPAFTFTGKLVSDGKGNISFSVTQS